MGHYARGEIWIPLDEWFSFVKNYMPKSMGDVAVGPPSESDGCIVVPYAINTECHPKDEAEPPAWLKKK